MTGSVSTRVVLGKVSFDLTLVSDPSDRRPVPEDEGFPGPKDRLRRLLASPIEHMSRVIHGDKISTWVIMDNSVRSVEGNLYALGYLRKLRDIEIKKVNTSTLEMVSERVTTAVKSQAFFVINLSSQIIAFEVALAEIRPSQFCTNVAAIWEDADSSIGNVRVYPLETAVEDIRREIMELDRIDKTVIVLTLPNPPKKEVPDALRRWLLKQTNAAESTILLKGAAARGLNGYADVFDQTLDTLDKYTSIEVVGRKGGVIKQISSVDTAPITKVTHDGTEDGMFDAFRRQMEAQ